MFAIEYTDPEFDNVLLSLRLVVEALVNGKPLLLIGEGKLGILLSKSLSFVIVIAFGFENNFIFDFVFSLSGTGISEGTDTLLYEVSIVVFDIVDSRNGLFGYAILAAVAAAVAVFPSSDRILYDGCDDMFCFDKLFEDC